MHDIIPEEVVLDEESHTYTLLADPDVELRSCTEFVDGFFERFDGPAVARKLVSRVPKYRSRTVPSLLAEWERAGQDGTDTHEEIAGHLRSSDEVTLPRARSALAWLEREYPAAEYEYLTERSICAPDLALAGTVDLLARHRETGEFVLIDWKTNKKIDRTPYNDKRGIRGPARRLGDCRRVKYGLQLSLYRYILESRHGIELSEQLLVHLTGEGAESIPSRYLKGDVVALLRHDGLMSDAGGA